MIKHRNPVRRGDQIECGHCGKQWDVNDPEPPECISWPAKVRQQLNLRRYCCNSTCQSDAVAQDIARLCDALEHVAVDSRISHIDARSLVAEIRSKYDA